MCLCCACVPRADEDRETGESEPIPDQEIEGYVLRETSRGILKWILRADYMATFTDKDLVTARGLKIEFVDREGEVTSVLVADRGELNTGTRDMIARGDVRVISSDGDSLFSDELHWLNEPELIRTDKRVVLIRKGNRVESIGMVSDPELEHITLKEQVTGSFTDLDIEGEEF
jgi:LPS export ABC transporter protein LptC